ncbi:MAG: hypothetical protein A3A80_03305 [Candidatus Terrybacteria bacterium RIFCSPLOWO2_01_FULL_44_24]|uniref:Transglycosylase SLT domain-containing protein n=1 Tax=Candidatus Terrybacteria bacterium RIFCSPHIGHO2_01_FULL_43_35 TaxID=1802361 RepID=A0A1G2PDF6_9BACT|nr:MAG: hypothetical protein A2828_00220 [Candidatus Terrybacteria bacterium RIFCSPHIGHO2_01_FULL_43_35]OHA51539.1 MAG: hypothetical protein A3A80_03305 [Candidatus Terrybacteria bacterium RIFCSPLOWO2_01_FULL_44_24]
MQKFSPQKFMISKFHSNQKWLGGILVFFAMLTPLFFTQGSQDSLTVSQIKQTLDESLDAIEAEMDQINKNLGNLKTQQATLAREIKVFDANIRKVELQIRRTDLSIADNEQGITEKEKQIAEVEVKLTLARQNLKKILLTIDYNDNESPIEIILGADNFSEVFGKIQDIQLVEADVQRRIDEIAEIKSTLAKEKDVLEVKKEELVSLRTLSSIEKRELEAKRQQRAMLLAETKGKEKNFNAQLIRAVQDAAIIRQQIFALEGTNVSMPFEAALLLAKKTSAYGNIRPAFLLAVLQKESHWGASVGTGNWRDDMNPKDWPAFIKITQELGLDPDTTPVSKAPDYGWGGAMGPAQFLPRTWLAWRDKVAALTGHNPPSPWNIEDAFTASALKLAAAGADQQTRDAEWKAAMIYFAGSNWQNPAFSFYADDIMVLADDLQEKINLIGG